MIYLLDTDVLSDLLKPSQSNVLLDRLARSAPSDRATSSITVGELLYGAYRRRPPRVELARRIDDELLRSLEVLPFDEPAARVYGSLRVQLERAGTPIGDADTRIASIALSRDLIVAGGNMRDFGRVRGLRIENWLA